MSTNSLGGDALRSAEKPILADPPMSPSVTPPLAVIALTKAGFGPRPGDVAAFEALGSTDTARLTAWVDAQLEPSAIDDSVCDTAIANNNFVTIDLSLEQAWGYYVRGRTEDCPTSGTVVDNGSDNYLPRGELERLTLLRAVHSEQQLLEVLCDVWHNHFHMQRDQSVVRELLMRFNRDVIRTHALGNFRTFLEAVIKSPSMLYYTENYTNTDTGDNEGLARSLFDNFTLGTDRYLGSNILPNEVAKDSNGFVTGYVDSDIFEAARCFTGWSVDNSNSVCDTGAFVYRDQQHDAATKFLLGDFIWANQDALQDGLDVLDRLASHPGTAQHICTILCTRLISDAPPQALVDSAAAIFHSQWQAADQIKQVVRHILLSAEFRTSWGQKIKRPFEFAVSAIRALNTDFVYEYGSSDGNDLIGYFNPLGQTLYYKYSDRGYADTSDAWTGTASMFRRWRFVNRLFERRRTSDNEYFVDVLSQTPVAIGSAEELVDYWVPRLLGYELLAEARAILVDYMAQGFNPTYDLPYRTDTETLNRLRMLIALILMTPSNQWG